MSGAGSLLQTSYTVAFISDSDLFCWMYESISVTSNLHMAHNGPDYKNTIKICVNICYKTPVNPIIKETIFENTCIVHLTPNCRI